MLEANMLKRAQFQTKWINLQISPLPRRATITLRHSEITQARLATLDARFMPSQNLERLTLRPGDIRLAPRRRSPGVLVLDEQMGAADFALEALLRGGAVGAHILRMVLAHVVLQGFAVGLGRRLPAGFLAAGVEVVGQVLAVGVPDFPA
jgi:hypothetical protein